MFKSVSLVESMYFLLIIVVEAVAPVIACRGGFCRIYVSNL